MSIEQKIQEYLDGDYNLGLTGQPAWGVDAWTWSESLMTWADDLVDTEDDMLVLINMMGVSAQKEHGVIMMIKEADDMECLTSKYEFIRKTKEWFMRSNNGNGHTSYTSGSTIRSS